MASLYLKRKYFLSSYSTCLLSEFTRGAHSISAPTPSTQHCAPDRDISSGTSQDPNYRISCSKTLRPQICQGLLRYGPTTGSPVTADPIVSGAAHSAAQAPSLLAGTEVPAPGRQLCNVLPQSTPRLLTSRRKLFVLSLCMCSTWQLAFAMVHLRPVRPGPQDPEEIDSTLPVWYRNVVANKKNDTAITLMDKSHVYTYFHS